LKQSNKKILIDMSLATMIAPIGLTSPEQSAVEKTIFEHNYRNGLSQEIMNLWSEMSDSLRSREL
jgi:hypothetical protein